MYSIDFKEAYAGYRVPITAHAEFTRREREFVDNRICSPTLPIPSVDVDVDGTIVCMYILLNIIFVSI